MELETVIRKDTHSIIGTVFYQSDRGNLTVGEYWSEPMEVQRFARLSCELSASFIPVGTNVIIQTSRHQVKPQTDSDWFDQDSYEWNITCSSFKYVDPYAEARWFRIKIIVGPRGTLKDLGWVFGGKNP